MNLQKFIKILLVFFVSITMSYFFYFFGDTWGIYGDAIQYVNLYEGKDALSPWSQRPLTPFIATIIPTSVKNSFLIVNYLCLAITSILIFLFFQNPNNKYENYIILIFWIISYPFSYYSSSIIRVDPMVLMGMMLLLYLNKNFYNFYINLLLITFFSFSHSLMILSSFFLILFMILKNSILNINRNLVHVIIYFLLPFLILILHKVIFSSGNQNSFIDVVIGTLNYSGGIKNHFLRFFSTFGPLFVLLFFFTIEKRNSDSLIILSVITAIFILSLLAADTLRVTSYIYIFVLFYSSRMIFSMGLKNKFEAYIIFISVLLYFLILGLNLKSVEENFLYTSFLGIFCLVVLVICTKNFFVYINK